MKETMVPIQRLVLDYTLYPRTQVQSVHVCALVEAILSGSALPPIVADEDSYRIVDGFHRYEAFKRLGIERVPCILKRFGSDADMFEEALRLNASHGRPLAPYERRRCAEIARELGLSLEKVADALHVRIETVSEWVRGFVPTQDGRHVPIKRGLQPSIPLTQIQQEVNEKWGGMNPLFYARQIIAYLEGGFYRQEQSALAKALDRIVQLWTEVKNSHVA